MADELKLVFTVQYTKEGATVAKTKNQNVTITGDSFTHGVQGIGTSEESLAISADIGTVGYVYIANLDASNFVEIGSTTGIYDIVLKAGEACLYRHNSATIYAKADTAPVNVEYIVFEE